MRMRISLLALAVSVAVLAPAASANSVNFGLTCGGTACGTVSAIDVSGGVQFTVTMSNGFSIQAKAQTGFFFNTTGSLSLSLLNGQVTTGEFGTVDANLISSANGGAGKFTFGVDKFDIPSGNTSVSSLQFTILGLSTSDLAPNNLGNVVAVHFCSPGAGGVQSTKCPSPTGFSGTTVPEPGTLALMGTGLVGLAGVLRRRFIG